MSTPAIRRRHTDADKLVNRLKNSMPDKFRVMVQMHLSFILDLNGSKLEEMFKEPEKVEVVSKRKSATPFSKKKGKKKLYRCNQCYAIWLKQSQFRF